MFLPVTERPAVRIYRCCHLKDRRAYPGHLARTVRRKGGTLSKTITLKTFLITKIETKGSPFIQKHGNKSCFLKIQL